MVNYKLIILPERIFIVSDEEIKEGDNYLVPHNVEGKIIAGLPNLPEINFNGFEHELGVINVEGLISEYYKGSNTLNLHIFQQKDFTKFIIKKVQLQDNKKFSEKDMVLLAFQMLIKRPKDHTETNLLIMDFIKKLSKPNSFNIKIELEKDYENHPELIGNPKETWEFPKITDNSIKIISIL